MFIDKEKKEEKSFKGDVLYIPKIDDIDKLLSVIFGMVSGYTKQEKRMPSKIVLNQESYNMIKKYRKRVIDDFHGSECILCTKIEINERKTKTFSKVDTLW